MRNISGRSSYKALSYKGLQKIADQSSVFNGSNLDSNFYPKKDIKKLQVEMVGFYSKDEPLENYRAKKICSLSILETYRIKKIQPVLIKHLAKKRIKNEQQKFKSCKLHPLANATCNFNPKWSNEMKENESKIDLKALSHKLLKKNTNPNFCINAPLTGSNFYPKKSTQKLQVKPPYFGLKIEQLKELAADDWDEAKANPAMLRAMVETHLRLKGLDPDKAPNDCSHLFKQGGKNHVNDKYHATRHTLSQTTL